MSHQAPLSQHPYDSSLPSQQQHQHQGGSGAPDPPSLRSPQPANNQGIERGRNERVSPVALEGQLQRVANQEGGHRDFLRHHSVHDKQLPYSPYQPYLSHSTAATYSPFMHSPMPSLALARDIAGETPPRSVKKRKTSSCKISPKGRLTDDDTYKTAIDFLTKTAADYAKSVEKDSDVGQYLVDSVDTNLLTDYFFHMMNSSCCADFQRRIGKRGAGSARMSILGMVACNAYIVLTHRHLASSFGQLLIDWQTVSLRYLVTSSNGSIAQKT